MFARLILELCGSPAALASAVDSANVDNVVLTLFEERQTRVRIEGGQLAERMRIERIVREDRHTVDAGAHDLIAFEVAVAFATASREADVVNVHGVASRVDAAVLAVLPAEDVRTRADREAVFVPTRHVGAIAELLSAVDEEAALIPDGAGAFALAEGCEADCTVGAHVHRGLDGGGGAGDAAVGALHAVVAFKGRLARHRPRIAGDAVVEVVLAEVARLEVDDAAGARRSDGIPHGPASTRDVDVLDTVDDFGQHITEVRRTINGSDFRLGLIASLADGDFVGTSAEV